MLTTVTTILGLIPMMLQINIDFLAREATVGAPSTQWWVSLSNAIVFGLGFATVLPLVVTPAALMLRETVRPGSSSPRSEEPTSELPHLMRLSYAVFFLKKKN